MVEFPYTLEQVKAATANILGTEIYQAIIGSFFLYKAVQIAGEQAFMYNDEGPDVEILRKTLRHVKSGGYLPNA